MIQFYVFCNHATKTKGKSHTMKINRQQQPSGVCAFPISDCLNSIQTLLNCIYINLNPRCSEKKEIKSNQRNLSSRIELENCRKVVSRERCATVLDFLLNFVIAMQEASGKV